MTGKTKLEIFKSVFRGREDAYGTEQNGKYIKIDKELSDAVLQNHLQGKTRIGQYPLAPPILDGTGVYWAVVDIDERVLQDAIDVRSSLAELGIEAYIERSKSKGHHVWIFFSKPVLAREARAILAYAVDGAGYELFPKQERLNSNGYGNYVNLPLYGVLNGNSDKTVFLDPATGYQPYPDQFSFLDSIQKITPERVDKIIDLNDLPVNKEAHPPGKSIVKKGGYEDMLPCVAGMMQGVSEGLRNGVCFTLAKHWRGEKNLSQDATLAILLKWNQGNKPPLEEREVVATVRSAYEGNGGTGYSAYDCDKPHVQDFCDNVNCPIMAKHKKAHKADRPYFSGNSFIPSRLANELMGKYRFLYAAGQLYIYQDGVFSAIGETFIKKKCRTLLGEDAKMNRVSEVIAHIQDMTFIDVAELNLHKHLINLTNGMYDIKAKKLLPHNEKYLSTIRIPVAYDPDAECPAVKKFWREVVPRDCIPVVEELFGYVLIPDTRFAKAFMLTGTGANGKSTFISLLEAFVGHDNTANIPLQELAENRFKRADLAGKSLNVFADLDRKALSNSMYFKAIVSGDAIDAERKHQDPFSFRPHAKLVFSANEIPKSSDNSYAHSRRWCIIDFPNRFEGKDADKELIHKLTVPEELSGVLNIALAGLERLFIQQDFTESDTTKATLENYKKANDTVVAFVSDKCERGIELQVERTLFYDAYMRYCEGEGFRPVSRRVCYDRTRAQGIGEKKLADKRVFVGIKLISNN